MDVITAQLRFTVSTCPQYQLHQEGFYHITAWYVTRNADRFFEHIYSGVNTDNN
jgi:hypothetical protein